MSRIPMRWLHAATVLATLTTMAVGQNWRTEAVPEVGIEIKVPDRLERLPMKLGERATYQRARMRPNNINDYVRSRFEWTVDVYEFSES